MKKTLLKEWISLKNNTKITENLPTLNIRLLQSNKVHKNALRTLFLKFKTQKTSPKRISNLTIKNDSLNNEKIISKNIKRINSNKNRIKVISKNESSLVNNKLNVLNNLSYENCNGIFFRNQLYQNSRYSPKSFENIVSIKLNNKEEEFIKQKYKSNNIINIKRKNTKCETNDFNKKIKKRIKIIRTHHDIYYRNYNNLKNITIKDYINNFNHSNKSTHNNCINRIHKKNYESVNISSNVLNIVNKEENLSSKKNTTKNKLNLRANNLYKKINNQTTPITETTSRKYSSKKNISNEQSFKINKNKIFLKDDKKPLLLSNNNSEIFNKTQSKKQYSIINNKNIKYIINKKKKEKNDSKLNNNEIKVLKPNKKKKIIIINKKNNSILYKSSSNNLNNDFKNISKYSEVCQTENKQPIIRKINNLKTDKSQRNKIINKKNYIITKKKISISNNKSKNSINNSLHNNQIIKNRTMINNKKNSINIKTSEKEKNLQKIQNRQQLIKRFLMDKKKSKINYIKNNALINKISKKSSEYKIINILPNINRNKKKKQYTLTYNSLFSTPYLNINNSNSNSCINNIIKKNKTKIEDNEKFTNNKHIDMETNEKNQNNIKHDSIEYNILKKEINNKIKKEYNNSNIIKKNYFFKESEKLSEYIKNYFNLNNDYPSSDISFYKFGRVIGKGAFGKVNLGLHILTGRIVAIKSFNKTKFNNEKDKNKITNEINLMKNLKHFSVVKLLDTIETEKYILLIMENVLGGDLLNFIKKRNKLQEKIAKFIFKQLLQSIKYIHNKNIVHRDIKLDNILIDLNNNIKLCDFGVGKYLSNNNEILSDQCGTPAYIAPEVVSGDGYSGFPVDLWSSGVVLYSLLMGTIPFKAQNLNELQGLIMSGNHKQIDGISNNANDLLNKLLEINPNKRINVDEALNHPWFSENIDDDNKFNLFTKAEQILLSKNNADYRNCTNEEIIENFTIENLDTNKFNENKNNKTKSYIFAPFNTSFYSDELNLDNLDIKENNLEEGLKIQNNIILFEQDANALNRQYELNNNGEIDHGVIINTSYEKEINKNLENENKEQNEKKENINNFSNDIENEIIEKENYIQINKAKISNDSNRNKYNNMNTTLAYPSTMTLDENVMKNMESLGYKKDYIQKCILNNELNYCHATYYLLLNSTELFN